jgi:hypothetical protein
MITALMIKEKRKKRVLPDYVAEPGPVQVFTTILVESE